MARSERLANKYALSPGDFWRTPPHIWAFILREYRPVLDAAALEDDALCAAFITPDDDALTRRWIGYMPPVGHAGPRWAYVNPPYGKGCGEAGRDLRGWMECCDRQTRDGISVVALVPPAMDTCSMRFAHEKAHRIRFFAGRISFLHPDTLEPGANPRGASCLIEFQPGRPPAGQAEYSYIDCTT